MISYQEEWWRSAFKRSGYGGALFFESGADNPTVGPAIVLLVNLGDFFIPMRSPETLQQIDYFIDRLVELVDWCVEEKLEEFSALANAPGSALSKAEQAANTLRKFSNRGTSCCKS